MKYDKNFNAKFSERSVIDTHRLDWVRSPAKGVDRKILDRIGGEIARATSIVRFQSDKNFPRHSHDGGEEVLVIDGVFSDEFGDYGPGTYLRNPKGTSHSPFSKNGCEIFVKLWQFEPEDTVLVRKNYFESKFQSGCEPGSSYVLLHQFKNEICKIIKWEPGSSFSYNVHDGGVEIYVLDGMFEDEFGKYPAGTWIRNPDASAQTPFSDIGCLLYVKEGHLCVGSSSILPPSKRF